MGGLFGGMNPEDMDPSAPSYTPPEAPEIARLPSTDMVTAIDNGDKAKEFTDQSNREIADQWTQLHLSDLNDRSQEGILSHDDYKDAESPYGPITTPRGPVGMPADTLTPYNSQSREAILDPLSTFQAWLANRPAESNPESVVGAFTDLANIPGGAIHSVFQAGGQGGTLGDEGAQMIGPGVPEKGALVIKGASEVEKAFGFFSSALGTAAEKVAAGNLRTTLQKVLRGSDGEALPGIERLGEVEDTLSRIARGRADANQEIPGMRALAEIQASIRESAAADKHAFDFGGPGRATGPSTEELNLTRMGQELPERGPQQMPPTEPAPIGTLEAAAARPKIGPSAVPLADAERIPLTSQAERVADVVHGPSAEPGQAPRNLAEWRAGRLMRYAPSEVNPETGVAEATGKIPGQVATPEIVNATANPPSAAGREFAGNIRLGKYVPAEIRDNVAAMYDADPQRFEAARRGVVTDAEVRDLATRAAADPAQTLERWKPGNAENAETIQALRTALDTQAVNVRVAHAAYQDANTSQNLASLVRELTMQGALQETVSGVTAEAGRALRVFRQGVSPEQQVLAALRHMAPGTDETKLAQALKNVNFDDPASVAMAARQLYQTKPIDWVNWYLYNSLLSGPRGRILDTVSSAIQAVTSPLETLGAVPFDAARAALTGGRREVFAREVPAEYVGMTAGIADGWRDALSTLAHGFTADSARADMAGAVREPISGGVKGIVANLPARSVAANDAFFRSINSSAALYGLATAQASREGLKGAQLAQRVADLVHSPTEELQAQAKEIGRYRVFQGDSELARGVANLKEKLPILRLLIPFHATAINLAKMGMERSPLGMAMVLGRNMGIGPEISARESSLGMSRAAIGSVIMASTVHMAQQGLVTGAAPQDEGARDAFYRQGKQPYSMLVNGQWLSYQALPMSAVLGAAATTAEALARGDTADAAAIGTTTAAGFAKALIEQPFLQGLASFLDVLNDPERFGPTYLESLAKMPIPQSLQTAARAADAIIRDPSGPTEAAMSVIPGLSDKIAPRLDAFGQPATRPDAQMGLGALNPFKPSAVKNDPVEAELSRLQAIGVQVDGVKVEPGMVSRVLSVAGENVRLTDDQKRKYQETSGKMAYGLLRQAIESPEWNTPIGQPGWVSDEAKAKTIKELISAAREASRPMQDLVPTAIQKKTDRAVRLGAPMPWSGAPAPSLAPRTPAAAGAMPWS